MVLPLRGSPADAYVRLANHVLSQVAPDQPAVLLFASPEDGTGTTSVVSGLAAMLAERVGEELLLVDGNLRQPELSGRLGTASARGLADVLAGTVSWRQVVCETAASRLRILPGGEFPTADSPPLENFGRLLPELSRCYRLVLIDAGSLACAEAAHMASHCTGTYLVVRLQHTLPTALSDAVWLLEQDRARLLGCVVIDG
jgi:receptor protein-tyrosine kinase